LPALTVEGDFLGAMCRAAGRAGVQIFAYYSVAIDDYQVRLHPDWAFVDIDGRGCGEIGFAWGCLNSPYGDFVLAQLEEILSSYPVDALWLDILALGPPGRDCVCASCRRRYREAHGGDLTAALGTPAIGAWKVESLERFLTGVHALVAAHRPGMPVSFNGAGPGFRRHPEAGAAGRRLLDLVDFLSDEGHTPLNESLLAKGMRAFGRPFEILTSNGIANEWVGWEVKPTHLLSLEAAVVASHGGSVGAGLSVLPDGHLPAAELAVLRRTADFLAERAAWFGDQRGLADVRVLVQLVRPERDYRPPEMPELPPPLPRRGAHHTPPLRHRRAPICNGLWDALREHHVAVEFVYEETPLADGGVLVLQGDAAIGEEVAERIRDFVRGGGRLLAEGHAGLLDSRGRRRDDFILADVLGVHFAGYAGAWDVNYLTPDDPALSAGLPGFPLHITGPALRVVPDGARVLARLTPPLGGEQSETHHTASLFNPPGPATDLPAVTRRRFGAGEAIYIGMGVGEYLAARRDVDPWVKRLVGNLIDLLLPAPLFRTDAPPGVECLLNRAGDRLLLHLLNHYAASEFVGAAGGPRVDGFDIEFNEERLGRVRAARVAPSAAPLAIARPEPGWARVVAPPFAIHQVVEVEVE
jgi:hypothetical protein